LFYIRLNGRICTKKKLSVPPSGRLISIRWNGSKNYVGSQKYSQIYSNRGAEGNFAVQIKYFCQISEKLVG
jgi:hypothetical protein